MSPLYATKVVAQGQMHGPTVATVSVDFDLNDVGVMHERREVVAAIVFALNTPTDGEAPDEGLAFCMGDSQTLAELLFAAFDAIATRDKAALEIFKLLLLEKGMEQALSKAMRAPNGTGDAPVS